MTLSTRTLIAVAAIAFTAGPVSAQSAYDVCRMGIAAVEKHRDAVERVREQWELGLLHAPNSPQKAAAVAKMQAWYADNMRNLDAQLRDLLQECDPGSWVRRGEPVPRASPLPGVSPPRARRPMPRRPFERR